MPYLGSLTISGPQPDMDEVTRMTEALAQAVAAGWQSSWVATGDFEPEELDEAYVDSDTVLDPDDGPDDSEIEVQVEQVEGSVLDHRVLGYPGGAFVLVVLDGEGLDFEQAALVVAALGRHLTTWSPGLLEYAVQEVKVSMIAKPYDAENWLPPLDEDDGEDLAPQWPLVELMDDDLQSLAARYFLAGAVRSLWNPARRVNNPAFDARDVAVGAADGPWGRELTSALGELLVRAARLESAAGQSAKLSARGDGDAELAADLLRRARATGDQDDAESWMDDLMRGHLLLEEFVEAHELTWNRIPDDESLDQTEARRAGQLRDLLWAGVKALATLAVSLSDVTNPWLLLDKLAQNGDGIVALLAERESERLQEAAEHDSEEVRSAAAAHAAVWLAICQADLLDTARGAELVDAVAQDVGAFHHVVYSALLHSGSGPARAAVGDQRVTPGLRAHMTDFLAAQEKIEASQESDYDDDGSDRGSGSGGGDTGADIGGGVAVSVVVSDTGDTYDEMHNALDAALGEDDEAEVRLRGLLAIVGVAAGLTASDLNPRRGLDGYISAPHELAAELLRNPAEYASLILSEGVEEDDFIRLHALAEVARFSAAAAGAMAADFPDLADEDPRTEPAARERARRWIAAALRGAASTAAAPNSADGPGGEGVGEGGPAVELDKDTDAAFVLNEVRQERDLPPLWPIRRLVAAAAQAAASLLPADSAADRAVEIFTQD
jgi:hypothetical protein